MARINLQKRMKTEGADEISASGGGIFDGDGMFHVGRMF